MRKALILCLAALTLAAAKPEPVKVSVTPRRAFAPAAFRIVVTVEPHPDNRELVIAITGESYHRASFEQLDGENAARIRSITYQNIPGGFYVVSAHVGRANNTKALRAVETVCVQGINESCD